MQEHPETATGTVTAAGAGTDTSVATGDSIASSNGSATAAAPRTASMELVKELPRGSVGVVQQDRNPQQNRSVAQNEFEAQASLYETKKIMQRRRALAKAARDLDHRSTAKLFSCGYK